ncbi:MAG: MFS transporter [Planctomycetaceae bacterium]|nr:MFS transporter [Planctomycetaceae bacterium]
MRARIHWRLSGMMALLYAVQGAFWPLLAVHLRDLGIGGRGRGWIFATMALGSLAMPLGAGQLVDRLMPIQRFLALVYALGTGFLVALACGVTARSDVLFVLFLVYWLLTAPASGLSNALAMRNLARPREEFGAVRLWGTVGWMAVGWLVSGAMALSGSTRAGHGAFEAFWIAAALSMVLAGYSLTLPHTQPLAALAPGEAGPRGALELLRRREVAVFLLTAFGVYLTMPFVYQVMPTYLEARSLPRAWISTAMTLGQCLEIVALAALPWLLRRLGVKGTLMVGMGAWAVRFGSLALDPPLWVAVAGTLLHGVGFACFTVGGQVFIDGRAPAHRRASAQALLVVMTSGVGTFLGNLMAGEIMSQSRGNYVPVFLIPAAINLALLLAFARGFRPAEAGLDRPRKAEAVGGTVARVGGLAARPAGP